MPTTLKTFDCVRMKKEIQATCLAEYEQMKDQYSSFTEFMEAKGRQSEWVKSLREKITFQHGMSSE